jgi:hypothetical protein
MDATTIQSKPQMSGACLSGNCLYVIDQCTVFCLDWYRLYRGDLALMSGKSLR